MPNAKKCRMPNAECQKMPNAECQMKKTAAFHHSAFSIQHSAFLAFSI
jgi:hypothetical protein